MFSLVVIPHATLADDNQILQVQGIKITPFIFDLDFEKGGSYTGTIDITNTTNSPVNLALSIQDFIPAGRHGETRFLPANENTDEHFSLVDWVHIIKQPDFLLGPQSTTTTQFRIEAPIDADEGTHYGGIIFSFHDTAIEGGNTIIQSLGAILIANIGHANATGRITNFSTPRHLYTQANIPFVMSFQNQGNVRVSPKGKIEIKNMFGSTVGLAYINKDAQISLPQTTRDFESVFSHKFMLGRYTAHLTLYFGNPKLEAQSTRTFWVVPWKFLVECIITIILTIFLLRWLIIRYNKWVIKRANI